MTLEHVIASFRTNAQAILEEQTKSFENYTNSHLLDGKLARLRVANAHLKDLKQKLNDDIDHIMSRNASEDANELQKKLHSISIEYINEYMANTFVKKQ